MEFVRRWSDRSRSEGIQFRSNSSRVEATNNNPRPPHWAPNSTMKSLRRTDPSGGCSPIASGCDFQPRRMFHLINPHQQLNEKRRSQPIVPKDVVERLFGSTSQKRRKTKSQNRSGRTQMFRSQRPSPANIAIFNKHCGYRRWRKTAFSLPTAREIWIRDSISLRNGSTSRPVGCVPH